MRRRNTSVVSVSFLRDRRKQEKEAERSEAALGDAGEPNNRADGPPTDANATEGSSESGFRGYKKGATDVGGSR